VVREVGDEDGSGLGQGQEGIFLDGCVGREDTAGESCSQCAGKDEVL